MFRNKYRIIRDRFCGFEVQIKRWWFPVWYQCISERGDSVNTHSSIADAKLFISRHKEGLIPVHTNYVVETDL